MVAYGRSKTANILFAVEFDRRHRPRGVRATAVHPGGIKTELGRHMAPGELDNLVGQINAQLAAAGEPPFQFKTIPRAPRLRSGPPWWLRPKMSAAIIARTAKCRKSPKG
jgi:NAD(P)-dependent dehydrogenase (short-subunit alcohol dehydrogenase family)